VVTVIACGVGITAGALTYLASHSVPQALLAAGTATGSSADLFRQFIGTEPECSASDHDDNQDDDHDGVEQRGTLGSMTARLRDNHGYPARSAAAARASWAGLLHGTGSLASYLATRRS
jgi:hypothetical protein